MKKGIISIRWSDMLKEIWYEIVLPNPAEYRPLLIPGKPAYAIYTAYFTNMVHSRQFDIVFPYRQFDRAIKAIPPEQRSNLSRPIKFQFMKTQKNQLHIKNWEVL